MAEAARTAERDPPVESPPSMSELNTRLMRAYLSGDGAAVERVMAEIAEAQQSR